MPDPASTIQHTLVLRRVDPEQGVARFYTLGSIPAGNMPKRAA